MSFAHVVVICFVIGAFALMYLSLSPAIGTAQSPAATVISA
jgi:hypothetical protein